LCALASVYKIAEDIDIILLANDRVPVLNQCGVHFIKISKRAVAHPDYICMEEMRV
jgi:hypothetical protein